MPISMISNLTI